ncbi:tyrosinase family protein [Streptomyces sp. SP18CS02]|uniref:tyrosinase family protein n=1 Tax=Streptomyces sp. SP18CS02 TaxID=3002531 RepID=UPI002E7A92B7|nr:tyrosinase family protein [Streptomyces sp. SP18CS02]MEE1751118.1 tyrosinase family protein [Streptomyces sp. SP18CS02]
MVYTRKDQRDLTRAERRKFVDAVLELKRSGRYDDFVRTHVRHYSSDGDDGLRAAHMAPSFLPWHRQYLLDFERALRALDPTVTVPYWDWTRDRTAAASLWGEDFMGGNGRRGDRQVMTGPFAHVRGDWTVTVGVTENRFLSRDFGHPADPVELPTRKELAWAMDDPVYDSEPWNSTSASGFRNKLEGWTPGKGSARLRNHNRVHRWVGGLMLGGASVNDPVFWLHHSFVDLLWSRWQTRNPGARYQPATPPPRGSSQYGRVVARHEPMPPFGVTPADVADHSRVYRYA